MVRTAITITWDVCAARAVRSLDVTPWMLGYECRQDETNGEHTNLGEVMRRVERHLLKAAEGPEIRVATWWAGYLCAALEEGEA